MLDTYISLISEFFHTTVMRVRLQLLPYLYHLRCSRKQRNQHRHSLKLVASILNAQRKAWIDRESGHSQLLDVQLMDEYRRNNENSGVWDWTHGFSGSAALYFWRSSASNSWYALLNGVREERVSLVALRINQLESICGSSRQRFFTEKLAPAILRDEPIYKLELSNSYLGYGNNFVLGFESIDKNFTFNTINAALETLTSEYDDGKKAIVTTIGIFERFPVESVREKVIRRDKFIYWA